LIEIYLKDRFGNRDPQKALRMIRDLLLRYPTSPMFRQIEQVSLFASGDYVGCIRSAQDYFRRIQMGHAHYYKTHLPRIFVTLGTAHLALGELKSAKIDFFKCLAYAGYQESPNQWGLWGVIRLAQVEDLLGEREAAKAHYRQILEYKDTWGYHALVRGYL